jgi:5'-nucleotidase
MTRKEFILKASKAGMALGLSHLPSIVAAATAPSTYSILHTNDVHSRLDAFPMDGGKYQGMGGIANRYAALQQIRKQVATTFLFDSGDIFQGTPYFNIFKGEAEMKAMTHLGYDAGTMGNHDFDLGIENFALQMKHLNCPIVVCNYNFSGTALEYKIPPYTIVKRNGIKIGVIGVGIELKGLVPEKLYTGVKYEDPIALVNEYAYYLCKVKKCESVVVLSHLGYSYESNKISDKILAKETRHVDMILGGHTHTFLSTPTIVKNADGKPVLINQVGFGGVQLGKLDFDKTQVKHVDTPHTSSTVISIKQTNV